MRKLVKLEPLKETMQPIASPEKTSRKMSPILAAILGVVTLLLVIGGTQLVQWLNPGQTITPNTVQKLEEVPMLMRHDETISTIAFNPHPNQDFSFASSSYGNDNKDGLIKLWNLKEEKATEVFAARAGSRFALSPDGKQLAAIDAQGAAQLWDLTQITNIFHTLQDSQTVYAVRFSPDGQLLASGRADGTIKLWNWKTGKVLRTWKGHDENGVSSIAFSPDGQTLASSSNDGIKLWNWKTGKALHRLKTGEYGADGLVFSPDDKILVSHNYDGTTKLWNWRNEQVIRSFQGDTLALSPDGQTLAGSSDDGIKLWNSSNGTERLTIKAGKSPFAFSPDGKSLASDSDNGTIQLWNLSNGRLIRSFQGREQNRLSLTFSPDNQTLISASGDWIRTSSGIITLWNVSDGKERLSIPAKGVNSVALSPDGQTLAIGSSSDQPIKLLPLDYQKKLATPLNVKLEGVRFFAFSSDNQNLILADVKHIKLLRLKDRREIHDIKAEPDEYFRAFALSPDAPILASGGSNGVVKLWNLQDGKLIRTLPKNSTYVFSVAFSPDGQMLASCNPFDRSIRLWNVGNGNLIRTIEAQRVTRVVFSSDGQLLVSNNGAEIQFWNPHTGQKLRSLKGHASGVSALAFSPDGQTLASGSDDQTIKLWRVKPKNEW